MRENRLNPRYNTMSRARITGVLEGDVKLKNLSITGCCLECKSNHDKIKVNETYRIDIIPKKILKKEFEIEAECVWIRDRDDLCEIGFHIIFSPTGRHFENYVNYLATHSTLA